MNGIGLYFGLVLLMLLVSNGQKTTSFTNYLTFFPTTLFFLVKISPFTRVEELKVENHIIFSDTKMCGQYWQQVDFQHQMWNLSATVCVYRWIRLFPTESEHKCRGYVQHRLHVLVKHCTMFFMSFSLRSSSYPWGSSQTTSNSWFRVPRAQQTPKENQICASASPAQSL